MSPNELNNAVEDREHERTLQNEAARIKDEPHPNVITKIPIGTFLKK